MLKAHEKEHYIQQHRERMKAKGGGKGDGARSSSQKRSSSRGSNASKGDGKGRSRSVGTAPQSKVKWITFGEGKKKIAMCCMKWLKEGKCDFKERTGKDRTYPHINSQAELDAQQAILDKELGQ